MLHGFEAKQPSEAWRKEAAVLLANIVGVHFVVPTMCLGKDPAVLVSLTDQAALHFGKRHIYGLTLPPGQPQLKWQQMSLSSTR